MPQFKGQLESEKIWDVGNYIGWAYMGWKLQPITGKYDELARSHDSRAVSDLSGMEKPNYRSGFVASDKKAYLIKSG
jgi:hypothetical protein